jgi:glutathione synthase/RimK-type ligase-like ATP-grasp enzyme
MTNETFVLVVSTVVDLATDDVVRRLEARSKRVLRVNTEDYPFARSFTVGITSEEQRLSIDGTTVPLPTAVWYRRMRTPARPEGLDVGAYDFCVQESRAAVLGSIQGLRTRWMSHPAAVWRAEFKPYQLAVARELGLTLPRTCITNEPAAVRQFANSVHRMIGKPVRSGHLVRNGQELAIFTSEISTKDLENLSGVELAPCIYQELLEKRHDIRVTIVGDRIFSAGIDSQSDPDARVDWRQTSNPEIGHFRVQLPSAMEEQLKALMHRLQLTFGAIDLVHTADDRYVFLEVNPSGQWLWLDDKLELGISDAVADWLAETSA